MKNQPLAVQIWLVFGITLIVSLLLVVLVHLTLRSFFTRESYTAIESAQSMILEYGWPDRLLWNIPPGEPPEKRQSIHKVSHILLQADGQVLTPTRLPAPFLDELKREALLQKADIQRYSNRIQSSKIFYVIRKMDLNGRPVFLVSYIWDAYRDYLSKTLFSQLRVILGIALLLSWIPAIWLSRYLTRPLIALEKHVKRIADRDWYEPINLQRRDEIGRLAQSIERMRQRLVQQDEDHQSFLQNVSHELKTPVMVIRSYVQSIHDGIFPKGDLSSTVKVIEGESERLEKRIHALLLLTKLDYLSAHEQVREVLDMAELIEDVVERLRWRRPELEWSLDLVPAEINGDKEQWAVAIENLIDNSIRYAARAITVSISRLSDADNQSFVLIRMWNDGPPIGPDVMKNLFHLYRKGPKGEFGLGLAIVKRIADLHQATVWADNEAGGAAFYIRIPRVPV